MVKTSSCLIALGANIVSDAGKPADTLRAALTLIHTEPNISIFATSDFWLTPAFPPGSGPDYCNAAAALRCDLPPATLLARLHAIETHFGRQRQGPRWQSRVLDLDLIGWDDLVLPDAATQRRWADLPPERRAEAAPEQLILPHPRLAERGFVLAPLAQIAPGWRHPLIRRSVTQLLADLPKDALAGMRILRAG